MFPLSCTRSCFRHPLFNKTSAQPKIEVRYQDLTMPWPEANVHASEITWLLPMRTAPAARHSCHVRLPRPSHTSRLYMHAMIITALLASSLAFVSNGIEARPISTTSSSTTRNNPLTTSACQRPAGVGEPQYRQSERVADDWVLQNAAALREELSTHRFGFVVGSHKSGMCQPIVHK